MDWSHVKDIIGKGAPILGTLLGGPAGTAVGTLISVALGTDDNPDAVIEKLQSDPESMVKVLQLQADERVNLQRLLMETETNRIAAETEQFKVAAADRASARTYAIEAKDYTARNLAYLYTVGFFGTLGCHIWMLINNVDIDPTSSTLLNVLEGILTAMVLGSKEFFFGSSSGDAKKSADLSQIAKG